MDNPTIPFTANMQAGGETQPIVTRDQCNKCKFFFSIGGPPECRRNAPQVGFTLQPAPGGRGLALATHSSFPNVKPNMWCGDFAVRLAIQG